VGAGGSNAIDSKESPMAAESIAPMAAEPVVLPAVSAEAVVGPSHPSLPLIVICVAQLMLVLDELIVNTALPHIQRALDFSGSGLQWIVTAYTITFGGLLLLDGRSGDILGRRRTFTGGIVLFTLASLAGGLATQSWWLVACRALQGTGAAFAAPAGLSLIAVRFPVGKMRNLALGVYAGMTGMGGAVGLIAGGLLTAYASWRWVFFVNVPLGILLVAGALAVIPESLRHARKWNLPGAALVTAGVALLVYGLSNSGTGPDGISHWGNLATIASLAGDGIALAAFVLVEARAAEPLLPLWIFANRNRAGVYLILLCLASAFFVMFFFITQFLQIIWDYCALKAGFAYLPFVGAFIVTAGICNQLVNRVGARIPMTIGGVLAPAGMLWLSRVTEHSDYLTGICLPFILFAAGAGFIFMPLTMTLVAGVSDEHSGVASSMFNAGQQIGGALDLAVIGTIAWTDVNTPHRDRHEPPESRACHPGRAWKRHLRQRPRRRHHHRTAAWRRRHRGRIGDHGRDHPSLEGRSPRQAGDGLNRTFYGSRRPHLLERP
jgi:EmrB/QacA subfamily drug resistance transporter